MSSINLKVPHPIMNLKIKRCTFVFHCVICIMVAAVFCQVKLWVEFSSVRNLKILFAKLEMLVWENKLDNQHYNCKLNTRFSTAKPNLYFYYTFKCTNSWKTTNLGTNKKQQTTSSKSPLITQLESFKLKVKHFFLIIFVLPVKNQSGEAQKIFFSRKHSICLFCRLICCENIFIFVPRHGRNSFATLVLHYHLLKSKVTNLC